MREKIKEELLKYNPSFLEDEIELGLSIFEEKEFKANSFISKAGEVCNTIFFADTSITRCFYIDK